MKRIVRKFLKFLSIAIVVCLLLVATHHAPRRSPVVKENMQGIWLTHAATAFLHHTTFLDEVLHNLSLSGYERIYFSVYGLKGTLYPTSHSYTHFLLRPPLTNPLKAAVQESRRQGLKPFAWFEYGMMLNPGNAIVEKHPDWLLKTAKGETVENGNVWLDPANPKVQEYILGHIDDILKVKGLEGIQLDDHWAVPQIFGSNNQRHALTNLTQKVYSHIKAKNPQLVVSVSPNPYNFAVSKYNQDWLWWVEQGIVDEIVLQIYRPTPEAVIASLSNSGIGTAADYVPVGVGISATWNVIPFSLDTVQKQVAAVKQEGYGYSIFSWEYLVLRRLAQFF
ncbi:family 10 glycosylhydrolase [Okeania sp.]|uniref:glycoside hydrolase family 10 protein n=1 Tax=Okeania sp. TaxID=3100323 RepID=UPI002B4AECE5|nr:family 10 glycosylhydrolase [Okeania sp.]MEB3341390.1 family 10 glycosylhydrolase [Okeania sp.]